MMVRWPFRAANRVVAFIFAIAGWEAYRRRGHGLRLLLAVAAGGVSPGGSLAQDQPVDANSVLRPVVEIARHGDLRDVAFVEKAFKTLLILEKEDIRIKPEAKGRDFYQRQNVFSTGQAQISLKVYNKPFSFYGRLQVGYLYLSSISTVTCISRQEVTNIFGKAFGAAARYVDLSDLEADYYRVIEDKGRVVKVSARYFGRDCLDILVIAQDL